MMRPFPSTAQQSFGFSDQSVVAYILMFYFIFFAILAVLALATYLFKGFGMYGIAKKQTINHAWLAFIPIASSYLQGELAGEIQLGKKTVKNPGLWMLLAPILIQGLTMVLYFGFLLSCILPIALNEGASDEYLVYSMMPSMFSFLGFFITFALLAGACLQAIYGVVRFNIHKRYTDPSLAVAHTVLGLMIPLYQAIYFFVLRNKDEIWHDYAKVQEDIAPQNENLPPID